VERRQLAACVIRVSTVVCGSFGDCAWLEPQDRAGGLGALLGPEGTGLVSVASAASVSWLGPACGRTGRHVGCAG
jgi:hypothetical protein